MKYNFDIDNTLLEITKVMSENPRRIGEIIIDFYFPHEHYSEKEMRFLEASVKSCPVALSLHPDIIQKVQFHFK